MSAPVTSKELSSENAIAMLRKSAGYFLTRENAERLINAIERIDGALSVAPIAKLTVRDGLVQRAGLYAPGLPDGEHDVFPVPLNPNGELQPFLGAAHEPSGDVLSKIDELLQTMIVSAEVFTDADGTVTGYKIKTGALHKIVGLRTHLFFPQNMKEAERAAPPPSPEQPIATAPKDGREVLVRVKWRAGIPGKWLVGHYMGGGHCIEDHPPIDAGWYFWNGLMFDKAAEPVSWAPLPPDATALTKGGEQS